MTHYDIRNSTAEFLIFMQEGKEDGVEVMYKNETIWATQKAIAQLFDVDRTVVTKHLKNIFESGELQKELVCAKNAHTASDGKKMKNERMNAQKKDALCRTRSYGCRVDC